MKNRDKNQRSHKEPNSLKNKEASMIDQYGLVIYNTYIDIDLKLLCLSILRGNQSIS